MVPSDILLLDEPTNHLDLETTQWLEEYLKELDRTVVLVSHDRAFLAAVVDHVLHFEGNTATPYLGSYEAFVQQRQERRLSQQRAFDKQQRTIASEADYIARNIAGQNTRQAKGRRKTTLTPSEAQSAGRRGRKHGTPARGCRAWRDQVVVARKT